VSARACRKRPFPTRFPTRVLKRRVGHPASVSPCSGGSLDPRFLFRGASLPAPFLMSRTTVTCEGHVRILSLFQSLIPIFRFPFSSWKVPTLRSRKVTRAAPAETTGVQTTHKMRAAPKGGPPADDFLRRTRRPPPPLSSR
jgi:hypothetical protein